MMVTTSADHTAKIWKTADFSQMTELRDSSQRWVWDVAFSADSQHVVTGKLFYLFFLLVQAVDMYLRFYFHLFE